MLTFFTDLCEHTFLQYAMLASLLAASAAGIIGSLVVVRRSTYLAGAVSHSILAGLGLARLLQRRFSVAWFSPMLGAVIVAIAVALLMAHTTAKRGKHRTDTMLSAIWTGGMALGISFVTATPGYQDDLMSYLFGSIMLVNTSDLWWMAALNIVIIITMLLCYNRFVAIAFDEELARLRGVKTILFETIFYVLTALAIVLLVRIAGIILAVALLTLPAAAAGMIARKISIMMVLAVIIGIATSFLGMAISYVPGLPPGATIVELALIVYLVIAVIKRRRKSEV